MNRLKKQVDFINEIEKLKTIKRLNMTLDANRHENSAEHSWHSAMIALIFLEYADSDLDQAKVIKLLLIHDLVEIYAGDTWLFDDNAREKSYELETDALKKLTAMLPLDQEVELAAFWQEFETMSSKEAQFAKVIDAIQPLLNHYMVAPSHYNPDQITRQQVLEKKVFIKDIAPRLWPLVEEIIEKSVQKGLYC